MMKSYLCWSVITAHKSVIIFKNETASHSSVNRLLVYRSRFILIKKNTETETWMRVELLLTLKENQNQCKQVLSDFELFSAYYSFLIYALFSSVQFDAHSVGITVIDWQWEKPSCTSKINLVQMNCEYKVTTFQ